MATKLPSFDRFVGACEQRGRYSEAKSLGGLEIDHKVNLGALLDAAIVRHGVLENPSDLHAHLAIPF